MKRAFHFIRFLLFAACGAHANPPAAASCEKAKDIFEEALSNVSLSCVSSNDCVIVDLNWNICVRTAARKGQETTVSKAREALVVAHRACGYVAPPCASVPVVPECSAGRCVAVEGMGALPTKPLPKRTMKKSSF